jgi:prepilin-type N-terminal cleavage/methylation domain-containing protein
MRRTSKRSSAFTLVEVMIAVSLGSMVLAGVLTTFLTIVRSGMRISSYSEMEMQTRAAFEQLGIHARMSNDFVSHKITSAGVPVIDYFDLTIPNKDLTATKEVRYGYDTSIAANKKFYYIDDSGARRDLVTHVDRCEFLRYDANDALIAPSVNDMAIKHIQVSLEVSHTRTGVAKATQVIRSSAFTIRNISIRELPLP